ncbi:MAG: hypothetical protein AAF389_14715 [Gemmatimonadota bacterium]
MADGLRLLRWRAAVLFVGGGLVFAWIVMSGRTAHTIQVDFSWHREALDGATVSIDGVAVGRLEPYGRGNFVTGFRVEPGEHVVQVFHEECEAVPETVRLGGQDGRVRLLMADLDDDYRCRVVLRD